MKKIIKKIKIIIQLKKNKKKIKKRKLIY
jgi:hypothetical protein